MTPDLVFAAPAAIIKRAATTQLVALAREKHAFNAEAMSEESLFFWPAEISSNRLDSYFTKMAPSSLRNYAEDAAAGVSFQNSHRWQELPLGRSLTGTYIEDKADLARVVADFFTVRGLNLNGLDTDNFIRGVEAGVISDVSIGFRGGDLRCSICGGDMLDWFGDCQHCPGVKYKIEDRDAKGNVTSEREEIAFGWWEDAHLSEVSAVYDGATPGAAILKANHLAEAGRMPADTARILEARYRIKLPGNPGSQRFPGVTTKEKETMEELAQIRALLDLKESEKAVDAVRSLKERAEAPPAAPGEAEQQLRHQNTAARAELVRGGALADGSGEADLAIAARAAADMLLALKPQAEDGKQYRADLIAEMASEAVRADEPAALIGDEKRFAESWPLATIRAKIASYKARGDKRFPGGRSTTDPKPGDPAAAAAETSHVPERAFRTA